MTVPALATRSVSVRLGMRSYDCISTSNQECVSQAWNEEL